MSKVTGVVTAPARAVAGASVSVATTGLRTTARVVGWALRSAVGGSSRPVAPTTRPAGRTPGPVPVESAREATAAPAVQAPEKKAPAKKTAPRKAAAKKAPSRKAPSRKAAVVAPALGLSEAEVEADPGETGTEPLLDPATTKAVASEAATMQRAADPDKG